MALSRRRVQKRSELKQRDLLRESSNEPKSSAATTGRNEKPSAESGQASPTGKRQKRQKPALLSRMLTGFGLRKSTSASSDSTDRRTAADAVDAGRPKSRRQRGKRRNWAGWIASAVEKTVNAVKSVVSRKSDQSASGEDGGDSDDASRNTAKDDGAGDDGESDEDTSDASREAPEPDNSGIKPPGSDSESTADAESGDVAAAEDESGAEGADEPEVAEPSPEEDDGDSAEGEGSADQERKEEGKEPDKGQGKAPEQSPQDGHGTLYGGGMVASSKMRIKFNISSDTDQERIVNNGNAKKITDEMRIRWATIQAGRLPADDPTPRPLREDEIKERKDEAVKVVQDRGHKAEEKIRDTAANDARMLIRRAQAADDEAAAARDDGDARAAARRAERLRDQAHEVIATRDRHIDRLQARVEQACDQERAHIQKEADKIEQRHYERLRELQAGLHAEVEYAVQNYYFPGDDSVELVEFDIFD